MTLESSELLKTSRFRVDRVTRQLRDGSLHHREVVRHPGAVTILPLLEDDRICLIRNYRIALDATLIELPAGTREAGESAATTAHRELIEETGYEAGQLSLLRQFFLSPGILDERMELFLATNLRDVGAQREVGEEIENLVVPLDEAIAMVQDGRIQDAKTIVGLLSYWQFRDDFAAVT